MIKKLKQLLLNLRREKNDNERVEEQPKKSTQLDGGMVQQAASLVNSDSFDPREALLDEYYRLTSGGPVRPDVAPGVIPESPSEEFLAMDAAIDDICSYAAEVCRCTGFPGYSFLAQLAQYSEYRSPSETTAKKMMRKWIRLTASGTDEASSKKRKWRI